MIESDIAEIKTQVENLKLAFDRIESKIDMANSELVRIKATDKIDEKKKSYQANQWDTFNEVLPLIVGGIVGILFGFVIPW